MLNQDNVVVAKFLRRCRIKKRLSQGDVAKKLGFEGPQYVSNWECGLSLPSMKYIADICKIYGIPNIQLRKMISEVKERKIARRYGLI